MELFTFRLSGAIPLFFLLIRGLCFLFSLSDQQNLYRGTKSISSSSAIVWRCKTALARAVSGLARATRFAKRQAL
jgi:hypothetical protein